MKKQNSRTSQLLAMLLCVVMVFAMIPATALQVDAAAVSDDGNLYYLKEDFSEKPVNSTAAAGGLCMNAANYNAATVTDGVFTGVDPQFWLPTDQGITDNYTIEFTYQVAGQLYLKVGKDHGESTAQLLFIFTGADSNSDRVNIYSSTGTATVWFTNVNASGNNSKGTHDIKIVVNKTAQTFQLYIDGKQAVSNGNSEFGFKSAGTDPVRCMFFQSQYATGGTVSLSNVKMYSAAWTVNQQAELGENIHMTFSGNALASSGIAKVKATVGDTEKTVNVAENAYSVTIPVAAAQMAETIKLQALKSDNTAVATKTYTVKGYLDAVKALNASDEEMVALIDHTLNYGAAAAAHFEANAFTAPSGLTLAEVPAVAKGGGIGVTAASGMELRYYRNTAINGNYTVEFTYKLESGSAAYVKLGPGVESTTMNVHLYLRTGNDRVGYFANPLGATTATFNYANGANGGAHTVKVTVNATTGTYQMWLDGEQVSYQGSADIPCSMRHDATAQNGYNATKALGVVCFDVDDGKYMEIYDFKVLAGETVAYSTNFATYAPVKSVSGVTEAWFDPSTTSSMLARNPLAGSCDGVTVNSANLLFEDQIRVRYRLQLTEDLSDYTIKLGGQTVDSNNIKKSGSYYYVYSEGINPQMYGTDQVLTVSKGGNTVTATYCPLDYISRMYGKNTTSASLKTLLSAMYNYYLAAVAYVA